MVLRIVALIYFARRHRRRRKAPAAGSRSRPAPGISVVVPAYNEAAGIAATVRSMVRSNYPGPIEVIVVDDGSTDETAAIVASLCLPGVRVISQPNAGKPAALNRGIGYARFDVLVLVDGDTIFDPNAVSRLAVRMLDPGVGAVSGNTKVANRQACSAGGSTSSTSWASTSNDGCSTCSAPSHRARRDRRVQAGHAR